MSKADIRQSLQAAFSLHQAGQLQRARKLYGQILAGEPDNSQALHFLGVVEANLGNFKQAKSLMTRSLRVQPSNIQFLENFATILFQSGDYESALQFSHRALQSHRNNVSLLYVGAIALLKLKRFPESVARFDNLLALQPNHVVAINERASALAEMRKYDAALAGVQAALTIQPKYAEAHLNAGNLYGKLRRHDDAVASFDTALALKPDLADAWLGRGNVFADLNRYDEAFAAYDKALSIKPDLEGAWVGRGNVFFGLRRYDQAFAAYDKALSIKPDLEGAWVGRGNVFFGLRRHDEAFAAYDKALSIKPDLEGAWVGHGNVFFGLRRYDEAFAAYDKALSIKPDLEGAWVGRGNVFFDLRRYDQAFAAYDKAFRLNPELQYVAGQRIHVKQLLCDWRDLEQDGTWLLGAVREGKSASIPFALLSLASSPTDQLHVARRYVEDQPSFPPLWRGDSYVHDRIRIAYLSADFQEHPIGHLAVGLFERHDKSRFEVTGISLGSPIDSPLHDRIRAAFEHFVDAEHKNDQEIADLIRQREIDIVVDLMGLTRNHRLNVLARRPAPIQVNYLGYIGTMGAPFIDYVIADEVALPFDQQPFFSENIVHLPDCFMPIDDRQETAPRIPSRAEAGLPLEGFVFCSFNNSYKLNRLIFEVWMRLLTAIPGSALWLVESNREMVDHLRGYAKQCGVNSTRIVFAPHVSYAEHLARQRLADLFLDTVPYNAGATAAAALWAGLPVITCLGQTFVGRMAASMLHAVGLRELITNSLPGYEALAYKIASDPALCTVLKERLMQNRSSHRLFDTARFAHHIEGAYTTMTDILRRGEDPRSFSVGP